MSAMNTVRSTVENGISKSPDKPGILHKIKLAWNWPGTAWSWACKMAKLVFEAGRLISAAEVSKREGEARKVNMEAESISAECNDKRQRTVRFVNEEIERIYSQYDQPEISKKLQIANLLAVNPHIVEHLQVLDALSFNEERVTSRLEVKRPDTSIVGIESRIPE